MSTTRMPSGKLKTFILLKIDFDWIKRNAFRLISMNLVQSN